ncbi:MAG: hypothetical protein LBD14_05900 [Puniceicoccales bacterium]|nr:hypothetical protein [Puniceicoccales bacterium]
MRRGFPEPTPEIVFVVLPFLDVRPSICMPKNLLLLITASRQYLFINTPVVPCGHALAVFWRDLSRLWRWLVLNLASWR